MVAETLSYGPERNRDSRVWFGLCSTAFWQVLGTLYIRTVIGWDGGGITDNWSDADNWSINALPTSADDVEFDVRTGLQGDELRAALAEFDAWLRADPRGEAHPAPGADAYASL